MLVNYFEESLSELCIAFNKIWTSFIIGLLENEERTTFHSNIFSLLIHANHIIVIKKSFTGSFVNLVS
jgi:hypothetical protein